MTEETTPKTIEKPESPEINEHPTLTDPTLNKLEEDKILHPTLKSNSKQPVMSKKKDPKMQILPQKIYQPLH